MSCASQARTLRWSRLKALVLLVLPLACFLLASQPGCAGDSPPATIRGRADIVDGDTLDVEGVRVRLFGIDAPEVGQTCRRTNGTRWKCGQYATVELDRLVGGKTVVCRSKAEDSYGRAVATCRYGETDLGGEMVRLGWALAYLRYSKVYEPAQERARSAGRGIWSGRFEKPWAWRARMRKAGAS